VGAGPAHQRRRVRPRVPTSHRAIRSRRRVRSTDSRMRAHVPARSTTKIGISQKPPSSAPSKQRAGELLRHDPVSVLAMDISGLHWAVGADRIAGGDWGRGLPRRIIVVRGRFAEPRRSPQAPASGLRFLFGSCNLVGWGRGMAVRDSYRSSPRTSRRVAQRPFVSTESRCCSWVDTTPTSPSPKLPSTCRSAVTHIFRHTELRRCRC